ncbi:TPA: DUF551 domain-containing protein [Klebsiella pneumoniae]
MTKSTITRERLQEIAEDGFLKHGESKELARMALAAMDSEPVAEVVSIYGDPEAFGEREIRPLVGIQQMPYGTKLYRHAQPAPVVPENCVTVEHRRVIEMLLNVCGAAFELADDSCQQDVDGEDCHVVPDDAFQKLSDALDEIENTLPTEDIDRPDVFLAWSAMPRAALKSILQPGNSPVIPDGWIPVSEHLPKEKGVYQVWNGKYVDNVPFWFGSFQSLHSELITHWMPLPAAPQEVNHG